MSDQLVPNEATLRKWIEEEGLTRSQIADRIEQQKGVRPSLPAISMARSRYGIAPGRPRYKDLLPWNISAEHGKLKEVRLLQKLGRRKAGLPLSAEEDQWLDGWLAQLEESGRPVVHYVPDALDLEDVFSYVPRVPEDGDGEYDVIRRPEVQRALDARARAKTS